MKEKLLRFGAIVFSVILLMASVGMIFWMARDERVRLVDREQAALEAAAAAVDRESQIAKAAERAGEDDTEKIFNDIDTLIAGLSMDDLPIED
ncbi:MAG: hypothetical protein WAT81_04870 [Candidatus Moraniibacteriota bacterium]